MILLEKVRSPAVQDELARHICLEFVRGISPESFSADRSSITRFVNFPTSNRIRPVRESLCESPENW
jgi:hypothetical protein